MRADEEKEMDTTKTKNKTTPQESSVIDGGETSLVLFLLPLPPPIPHPLVQIRIIEVTY